jgi:sugar lactone lactonase YvrE
MTKSIAPFVVAVALAGAATHAQKPEIVQYPLPANVTYPEGIAYDAKSGDLYTGSALTGIVYRMSAKAPGDKSGAVVAPEKTVMPVEPFPALLGMKIDAGRLWIAGGRTGRMVVLDARTGKVLKGFETPAQPAGLINDVAIAGPAAYFTDTLRPTLWRVPFKGDQIGDLEPWLQFSGGPLEYAQGPNLNGIAATPDGRYLIVVQMNKGLLFRIGVADKQVTAIDIGGESLSTGDGLVLDGSTLYVVRQGEQEVVTISLSSDLSTGKVVSRFKNPALLWPATAVKVGDRLLVVPTQFNKRTTNDPVLPFSIIGIPVSMLAGKYAGRPVHRERRR